MKISSRVCLLAAMAAITAASGSFASGFNAKTAADYARANTASEDRLSGMAQVAEEWRAGMVSDPITFMHSRAPLEQSVVANALGQFSITNAYYTSWLFRAAIPVVAGDAHQPVVTFYNPIVDVALVSSWYRIDSVWRMAGVWLFDGAALRAASGNTAAAWNQAAGSYANALADNTASTLQLAASLRTNLLLPSVITETELAGRLELMRQNLETLNKNPARLRAANQVRSALADATPGVLALPAYAAPTTASLETINKDVRRSLVKVAAFERSDGGYSVLVGSPLRPRLLFLADFASGNQQKPTRINVVNFATARVATVASDATPGAGG
jgi:hypothetical protein